MRDVVAGGGAGASSPGPGPPASFLSLPSQSLYRNMKSGVSLVSSEHASWETSQNICLCLSTPEKRPAPTLCPRSDGGKEVWGDPRATRPHAPTTPSQGLPGLPSQSQSSVHPSPGGIPWAPALGAWGALPLTGAVSGPRQALSQDPGDDGAPLPSCAAKSRGLCELSRKWHGVGHMGVGLTGVELTGWGWPPGVACPPLGPSPGAATL